MQHLTTPRVSGIFKNIREARFMAAPRELWAVFMLAYIPLFLAYFAHSFTGIRGMGTGLTTIPTSFWVQEQLLLTPGQLEFAYFTIAMPWVAKVLVGHMVDRLTVTIRKRLIYIAGACMAAGFFTLASVAGNYEWLIPIKEWYGFDTALGLSNDLAPAVQEAQKSALQSFQMAAFAVGFLFISLTIMLQDVILDPMSRHIVAKTDRRGRPLPEKEYRHRVGLVQTWCRISFNVASILGMAGAWILMAVGFSMAEIFLAALIVPVATILAVQHIRLPHKVATTYIRPSIVVLALASLGVAVWAQVSEIAFAREISFVVTFIIVVTLMTILYRRDTTSPSEMKRGLLFTMFALFFMRFAPEFGESVNWWHREVLGFDRAFETQLGIFGSVIALLFMVFLYRFALRGHLGWILVGLNAVIVAFSFMNIGFWYGIHEWLGGMFGMDPLSAVRVLAWVDTAGASPFVYVFSLIAFVILAQYADDVGTATWFTVFAMFLNLGINAMTLATGYLNDIFEVSRGTYENGTLISVGDYSQLGALMWTSVILKLIIPTIVVVLLLTPWRDVSNPYAYAIWRLAQKSWR